MVGPMRLSLLTACVLAALVARSALLRAEIDQALLFRVFLADGHTLVSYGEFARVGDRVVLSLALGSRRGVPRLHLVSIPAVAIDWTATDRYSKSARVPT